MPAKNPKKTKKRTTTPVIEEIVEKELQSTQETEIPQEQDSSPDTATEDQHDEAEHQPRRDGVLDKDSLLQEKEDEAITHEERARDVINGLNSLQKKQKEPINFKMMFFTMIFTAILVALVAGGIYVYFTGLHNLSGAPSEEPAPEATPIPSAELTATPSATPVNETVDVSVFKVSVLNGSGKIGEAGRAQRILEDGGFEVVNVGNASRYDYAETIVQVKDNVPDGVLAGAKRELSAVYSVSDGDALPDTSPYDIVVTVGTE